MYRYGATATRVAAMVRPSGTTYNIRVVFDEGGAVIDADSSMPSSPPQRRTQTHQAELRLWNDAPLLAEIGAQDALGHSERHFEALDDPNVSVTREGQPGPCHLRHCKKSVERVQAQDGLEFYRLTCRWR
jgi:hypothetical protein